MFQASDIINKRRVRLLLNARHTEVFTNQHGDTAFFCIPCSALNYSTLPSSEATIKPFKERKSQNLLQYNVFKIFLFFPNYSIPFLLSLKPFRDKLRYFVHCIPCSVLNYSIPPFLLGKSQTQLQYNFFRYLYSSQTILFHSSYH